GALHDGFFVRAFVYLRAPFPEADFMSVHFGGSPWMQLVRLGGRLGLQASPDLAAASHASLTPLDPDGWRCIEWQVLRPATGDGGSQYEVRVWLDEQEVPALHQDHLPQSQFDLVALGIGATYTPGVTAGDPRRDDIAL